MWPSGVAKSPGSPFRGLKRTSGWMARMSNAAYKTLHALALRARILGDARRPGAEEEFQELERLGIVSQGDKGHLFCFPSREQLMQTLTREGAWEGELTHHTKTGQRIVVAEFDPQVICHIGQVIPAF